MSTELFRKYIDIINESQQPEILNEGLVNMIKPFVPKIMKMLGLDAVKDIAEKVKAATGGDYSLTADNAKKVATALGFDKNTQAEPTAEGWGLAGNWQGKLLQALHLIGLGVGVAGTMGAAGAGSKWLLAIGLIALMVSETFWGDEPGQVGAMGKHDRKSTDTGLDHTDRGPAAGPAKTISKINPTGPVR